MTPEEQAVIEAAKAWLVARDAFTTGYLKIKNLAAASEYRIESNEAKELTMCELRLDARVASLNKVEQRSK